MYDLIEQIKKAIRESLKDMFETQAKLMDIYGDKYVFKIVATKKFLEGIEYDFKKFEKEKL